MAALRIVLGGIFLWAGAAKVLEPTGFLVAIHEYETGLPETVLRVVAVTLPWIEVLSGLAIVTGIWRETGLTVAALLIGVFLIATAQAWIRDLDIACGCFGAEPGSLSLLNSVRFAFAKNVLLLGIVGALLVNLERARRNANA